MNCQMMRVISSPSSSTTVPCTLILDIRHDLQHVTFSWYQDISLGDRAARTPRQGPASGALVCKV